MVLLSGSNTTQNANCLEVTKFRGDTSCLQCLQRVCYNVVLLVFTQETRIVTMVDHDWGCVDLLTLHTLLGVSRTAFEIFYFFLLMLQVKTKI